MRKQLEIGDKLYANWGAYFPMNTGEVTDIAGNDVTVVWEAVHDEKVSYESSHNLDAIKSERPEKGSGIGVYYNFMDAI